MNTIRKKAYNILIYQAFLDIKNFGELSEETFNRNMRIAHAFHNLAESVATEFKDFNEENFWCVIDSLEVQYDLYHYKKIFNEMVNALNGEE
ncbi:hypothetical protein HQN90_01280 [Paenibacillus alba]|uniref:hypothetical protein n=1 Tax=Paenibacillus alba TaxID=1197127 RepID=UPI001566135E|nr:hypothetical protein [Paenibacillus alba]NQX64747.1 hypothetical protein [Paenibacillus alba]